jgi:dTDP-4-amino-4,6-dideoxygalactose transaminase
MIPINKPTIVRKDLEYVLNCLITERLEEGELTKEFEKAVAHHIQVKNALATNSFTSAMHLALLSLEIQEGDEVIISAYADSSILNAINYIKAKPVPVDVEMSSYIMDVNLVKKAINNQTKAIIVTHNFGLSADLDPFLELEIPIIEDCSMAFGSSYKSEITKEEGKLGRFGMVSVFSFDTNTMITTGNGGMILSQKADIIKNAKKFKYNPLKANEEYQLQYDYRMADIAAALGLSQLKILNKLLDRRKELATFFNEKFKLSKKYSILKERENQANIYSKYVLLLEGNEEKAITYLRKNKIDIKKPIIEPVFKALNLDEKIFPNTSHCYHKLLEIPVFPSIKKNELEKIANSLLKVL